MKYRDGNHLAFLDQVRHNCQIASASQVGLYSLCGMLLRLRQLYKWEHGLPPWQEPEPPVVLEWIAGQEERWGELAEATVQELGVNGDRFDPFAVEAINAALGGNELAYGAGYTRGLAPTFFVAEVQEVRRDGDLTILVLGAEAVRDLDAAPALRQGERIYARLETLAYTLWDWLADPTQQHNAFLRYALKARGLEWGRLMADPASQGERYLVLVAAEMEAVIAHEIGEARETALGEAFGAALQRFPQTRLELWVRALKDALADCNDWGRLQFLITRRDSASLAFMLAWRPGLYALLVPELEAGVQAVLEHRDWAGLERLRVQLLGRLRGLAREFADLMAAGRDDTREALEDRFLAPLGL